jgi:enoyl-CoA hydratase
MRTIITLTRLDSNTSDVLMIDSPAGIDGLREERDGHVVTLTLDRPDTRNALSNELLIGLAAALTRLDADQDVRCIVLAGGPKVFASGADIRSLAESEPAAHYFGARVRAWEAIRAVRTPSIAAVAGFCLGGGLELAISCGIVFAAPDARFGLPETMLGLIPAAGGTQRLPAAIGRAKALDMILTGRMLDASEAEAAGLVARVVAGDELLSVAASAASDVAARGPLAQRLAREIVEAGDELPLSAGLLMERRAFAMALASPDAREGIAAFLEKRSPDWAS